MPSGCRTGRGPVRAAPGGSRLAFGRSKRPSRSRTSRGRSIAGGRRLTQRPAIQRPNRLPRARHADVHQSNAARIVGACRLLPGRVRSPAGRRLASALDLSSPAEASQPEKSGVFPRPGDPGLWSRDIEAEGRGPSLDFWFPSRPAPATRGGRTGAKNRQRGNSRPRPRRQSRRNPPRPRSPTAARPQLSSQQCYVPSLTKQPRPAETVAFVTHRSALRASLSAFAIQHASLIAYRSSLPRASQRRRRRGHDRSQSRIRAPRSFAAAGLADPETRRSRSIVTLKSPVPGPRRCGLPAPGAAGTLPRFSRWTR